MIRLFGAESSPECQLLRNWLTAHGGSYTLLDPERDARVAAEVAGLGGETPILVWPDGSRLVRPTINELIAAHARGSAASRSGAR